jgi:hypothetical protein
MNFVTLEMFNSKNICLNVSGRNFISPVVKGVDNKDFVPINLDHVKVLDKRVYQYSDTKDYYYYIVFVFGYTKEQDEIPIYWNFKKDAFLRDTVYKSLLEAINAPR